jgi:hypothetical protein
MFGSGRGRLFNRNVDKTTPPSNQTHAIIMPHCVTRVNGHLIVSGIVPRFSFTVVFAGEDTGEEGKGIP